LYLAEVLLHVDDVDEDVVGAQLQPVLDTDYLHDFGLFLRELFKELEYFQHFTLFRGALATHEIADLEGDQIWRRGPTCLRGKFGLVEFLRDF
jgi:hypothetical protein